MADVPSKRSKNKHDKIYRGAYIYTRSGTTYCEENFDVYVNKRDLGHNFVAEVISRVPTGELLRISVDYFINKNYMPTKVFVERALGNDVVEETYEINKNTNKLIYTFSINDEISTCEMSTPPVFHISTPAVCTSMLLLRSKKFDSNAKNFYSTVASHNEWEYKEKPHFNNIALLKVGTAKESMRIGGANVSASEYRLFPDSKMMEGSDNEADDIYLRAYLSSHLTIPYALKTNDGTEISIKYLNDFTDKE